METPRSNTLLNSIINEFDPVHDLDRLKQILDLGLITPDLQLNYNRLQSVKHLVRGALVGVLIAPSSLDFYDTAVVAVVCAVVEVVQYSIRAIAELDRRGY